MNFVTKLINKPTYVFDISPTAYASNGPKGLSISNPISNVVLRRGETALIEFNPNAVAIAGPGGIAIAESELNILDASTQYFEFYGGAKGQYLEVKKNASGSVISEKIVPADSISSENINKNNDENLLSKVLAANLQSLKSISSNLLKLHNLGRKTGSLGDTEKARFKNQLSALGETASNTIKLIDEVNEDIDTLFRKNKSQFRTEEEDEVVEEGIAIESPSDENATGGNIIAEAKPVGLAVVGEYGLAASRPMATAVAASGVAIARPVGTAIAGIDPTLLGIKFDINQQKRSPNSSYK